VKLTDKRIIASKYDGKNYSISDEYGLRILVKPKGKYFIHRYMFDGRQYDFHIGTYPSISLKKARQVTQENRIKISNKTNPRDEKANKKNARKVKVSNTFELVAEKYFQEVYRPNTKQTTWKKVIPYFANDIYSYKKLGSKPIDDIKPLELYEACMQISHRGAKESAKRVLRMISNVYAWATLLGLAQANIAYGLAKSLPTHNKGNYKSATDPIDFAEVLKKIDCMPNDNPLIKVFLQLMPLVFSRQGELRAMKWSEVSFVKAEWTYVVGKTIKDTKGKPHTVPLSSQAVALIKSLMPFKTTSPYVFYSDRSDSGYLSDSAISRHLRACGVSQEETSLHGFRASARTIGDEILEIRPDVLEVGLSHKNPTDRHGGAYTRADFIKQRRVAMQQWADYCDGLISV
jgi:integrase